MCCKCFRIYNGHFSFLELLLLPMFNCFVFYSVRLFVGSEWSFGFFIPATTANDLRLRRISIPNLIHYIILLSYFLRKSQYFPFQCWVPIKGYTGTIFITSLVWRDPWLGIEPGTSCTRHMRTDQSFERRHHKPYGFRRNPISICCLCYVYLVMLNCNTDWEIKYV